MRCVTRRSSEYQVASPDRQHGKGREAGRFQMEGLGSRERVCPGLPHHRQVGQTLLCEASPPPRAHMSPSGSLRLGREGPGNSRTRPGSRMSLETRRRANRQGHPEGFVSVVGTSVTSWLFPAEVRFHRTVRPRSCGPVSCTWGGFAGGPWGRSHRRGPLAKIDSRAGLRREASVHTSHGPAQTHRPRQHSPMRGPTPVRPSVHLSVSSCPHFAPSTVIHSDGFTCTLVLKCALRHLCCCLRAGPSPTRWPWAPWCFSLFGALGRKAAAARTCKPRLPTTTQRSAARPPSPPVPPLARDTRALPPPSCTNRDRRGIRGRALSRTCVGQSRESKHP